MRKVLSILVLIVCWNHSAGQTSKDFETHFENFELFWYSKPINVLRDKGLLVL